MKGLFASFPDLKNITRLPPFSRAFMKFARMGLHAFSPETKENKTGKCRVMEEKPAIGNDYWFGANVGKCRAMEKRPGGGSGFGDPGERGKDGLQRSRIRMSR